MSTATIVSPLASMLDREAAAEFIGVKKSTLEAWHTRVSTAIYCPRPASANAPITASSIYSASSNRDSPRQRNNPNPPGRRPMKMPGTPPRDTGHRRYQYMDDTISRRRRQLPHVTDARDGATPKRMEDIQ